MQKVNFAYVLRYIYLYVKHTMVNTKRFTKFTNCNLSRKLVELTLLFFNDVEEHEFPLTVQNRT